MSKKRAVLICAALVFFAPFVGYVIVGKLGFPPSILHSVPIEEDFSLAEDVVPRDLPEMIQNSQLIVLGSIKAIERETSFMGYGSDGRLLKFSDISSEPLPAGFPSPELPIVDYALEIETLYKGATLIKSGQKITFRVVGTTKSQANAANPLMPQVGDKNLFFLGMNPDGTYGLYYGGGRSRLIVDGQVLRKTDRQRSVLKIDDKVVTLADVLAQFQK